MTLASESRGEGRDVTFVHGFTQTRSSWFPVTDRVQGIRATLIDAPGHGGSVNGAVSLWDAAGLVADTMPAGTLVGYSMGARIALHTALARAETVTSLALVSGTPGIEDPDERRARRESDNALAARIESIGVPAFVDEWLAGPMFAGLDDASAMRQERLRNTARGLADSLRFAGTGTQDDLWPRLPTLRMPVLIVCGANDDKFAAIAQRMHNQIPGSVLRVVDGAGHTVHLERPDEFARILSGWLSTTVR